MIDILKDNDIVITSNNYKKEILKEISSKRVLMNLKFMTIDEFKIKLFGSYKDSSIYYLMKQYNYKYEIAKMYLDNFNSIDYINKFLIDNDLIIEKVDFIKDINRIVLIGLDDIDKYVMDEIKKYNHIIIDNKINNYIHPVYEFQNIEEEINYVALNIIELLKSVNINEIFIVNAGNEYEIPLKRLFSFYNIPVNVNVQNSIYGTAIVKQFLSILNDTKDIKVSLNGLTGEIVDIIIDVVNKYSFTDIDDTVIECIEYELKNKTLPCAKLKDAVNIINLRDMSDNNNYYFIVGFNQGKMPVIHKDEDFLSDNEKEKIGILTSNQKNIIEKKLIHNKIINYKNIMLTYKMKTPFETYYPSSLIEEFGLEVKKDKNTNYNYSDIYNKIVLGRKIDKLIKYNEIDNDLSLLYSNYNNIDYLTYDNKFTGLNKELFYDHVNRDILLSYSSLKNYYNCGFRYYIENILKINKYEDTFMTYIGNLFHYILSIAFNDNFDFEKEFNMYVSKKELSSKEKFFINKLKEDLLFTIDTINNHNSNSNYDKSLYEQKIYVNKDRNIKVSFMGIIDKINYKEEGSKTLLAIIDYKTGNTSANLNNTIYGLDLQLPVYLYLAKNHEFKDVEIAGFYLQKVVHNKLNYQEKKDYIEEIEKLYRLDGYSNSNESILGAFDKTYMDSTMIKGMKVSSKGFYNYAKTLSSEEIDSLVSLVDNKIDEAIDNILDTKFDINPKQVGLDLVGCEYCKYSDICFKREEDIVRLKEQKYEDFLGCDKDA